MLHLSTCVLHSVLRANSHMCVCCLEQVVPHAAAAGLKQQHAATIDIAALAVSSHVGSALVVPQYIGAVRGRASSSQVLSHWITPCALCLLQSTYISDQTALLVVCLTCHMHTHSLLREMSGSMRSNQGVLNSQQPCRTLCFFTSASCLNRRQGTVST